METVTWRTPSHPAGGTRNDPADDLGVEIHHTATDDGAGPTGGADNAAELVKLMRSVWRYHVQTKGWADVFYGFVVARDGSIAVGRGFDRGTSNRHKWITVCLAGDYDQLDATPEQVASVAAIRAEARRRLVGDDLRAHGDRDATACPGAGGRWLLEQLRAGAGVAAPGPTPAREPFSVTTQWRWVEPGARGGLVKTVQAVASHTFGQANVVGPVDGVYGKRTATGVANVQRFFAVDAAGEAGSGSVGPATAAILLADWEAMR